MTLIADTHPEGAGLEAAGGAAEAATPAALPKPDAVEDGGDEPGAGGPGRGVIAIPPALEADLRAGRDDGQHPDSKPRTVAARLLDYSAHAAMIVGLIGFAWTVSNHVVNHPAPVGEAAAPAAPAATEVAAAKAAPAADPAAEMAELRRSNERLAADVGGLRAQVEALASAGGRMPAQVADRIKGLQAAIDGVQGGLAAARRESAAASAGINARLDGMAREHDASLARPERDASDLSTGSLPPARTGSGMANPGLASSGLARPAVAEAVPMPPAKPEAAKAETARAEMAKTEMAKPEPNRDAEAPPVIAAYVVRDVSRGVALIEGRRGMLEVVPGVSIPGAGVVKSIERRGKGWTVITTRGQLAYAAPLPTYRRDGGRDYYPSYRYDF